MKSNIRSKYIKDFLSDKEELKAQMNETTKETIKDLLGESVKENLKKIISEAEEDSYEEEEVDSDSPLANVEDETEESATEEVADTEDAEFDSEDLDGEEDSEEEADSEEADDIEDSESEEVWSDLEQYKDENGEYDLTGMDKDSVIRVLKVMNPETDGVRVVKNDSGALNVTVPASDDETEFIIDIDDTLGANNETEESEEMMNEEKNEFTSDYQKVTAMTGSAKETANPKDTYSMDKGVDTSDSKHWVGNSGDMSPYSETVNENVFEIELDDDDMPEEEDMFVDDDIFVDDEMVDEGAKSVAQNGPNHRGMSKNSNNTNDKPARGRHTSEGGEMSDGMAAYRENVNRKMTALVNENKELKNIISVLKQRVNEAITVNYNLGKVAKLFTENTTSRQEKIDIISRFDKVQDIKEAKKLYETIDKELKSNRTNTNTNSNVMQLAESKNSITETPMYKSEDINETLDLMRRIDSLGKK